jgi:hypothetical protein
LGDKQKTTERASSGLDFLNDHRLPSLDQGKQTSTDNFRVQILRESAKVAARREAVESDARSGVAVPKL